LDEQQQASVLVEACAQVIEEIVEKTQTKKILIGLGMPGLKTENRRGIAVVANGPRMIRYSDQLEDRLSMGDIEFISPIDHIGSDADYCGIGENYSSEGLFRTVENAYYLGGGTGVADAMKLNNELVPFDATKDWIAKTWEMKSQNGLSLERFASASGIQSIYADIAKIDISELNNRSIFPLQIAELAKNGDNSALETFNRVAENIALLLFERISTMFSGWRSLFEFVNPNRADLSTNHQYEGKFFERIIIGQRLGELFEAEAGNEVLQKPVLEQLNSRIESSKVLTADAKTFYSELVKIIQTSKLREAPAIGAGIDAYLTYLK
jgi:predicted NBD/HSP70 family sugar kinase